MNINNNTTSAIAIPKQSSSSLQRQLNQAKNNAELAAAKATAAKIHCEYLGAMLNISVLEQNSEKTNKHELIDLSEEPHDKTLAAPNEKNTFSRKEKRMFDLGFNHEQLKGITSIYGDRKLSDIFNYAKKLVDLKYTIIDVYYILQLRKGCNLLKIIAKQKKHDQRFIAMAKQSKNSTAFNEAINYYNRYRHTSLYDDKHMMDLLVGVLPNSLTTPLAPANPLYVTPLQSINSVSHPLWQQQIRMSAPPLDDSPSFDTAISIPISLVPLPSTVMPLNLPIQASIPKESIPPTAIAMKLEGKSPTQSSKNSVSNYGKAEIIDLSHDEPKSTVGKRKREGEDTLAFDNHRLLLAQGFKEQQVTRILQNNYSLKKQNNIIKHCQNALENGYSHNVIMTILQKKHGLFSLIFLNKKMANEDIDQQSEKKSVGKNKVIIVKEVKNNDLDSILIKKLSIKNLCEKFVNYDYVEHIISPILLNNFFTPHKLQEIIDMHHFLINEHNIAPIQVRNVFLKNPMNFSNYVNYIKNKGDLNLDNRINLADYQIKLAALGFIGNQCGVLNFHESIEIPYIFDLINKAITIKQKPDQLIFYLQKYNGLSLLTKLMNAKIKSTGVEAPLTVDNVQDQTMQVNEKNEESLHTESLISSEALDSQMHEEQPQQASGLIESLQDHEQHDIDVHNESLIHSSQPANNDDFLVINIANENSSLSTILSPCMSKESALMSMSKNPYAQDWQAPAVAPLKLNFDIFQTDFDLNSYYS